MLQRAASNAYSWWWASHIRTKQSKWLEQNLQDMEEKVQAVLKLIEEDGDSFAKRAEMYYKKRPELINFVEETYRAYRSLAERYDHISTELQNANTTIASVFPEQVHFSMDDDDEEGPQPRSARKFPGPIGATPSAPKVPKPPHKNMKSLLISANKNMQPNSNGLQKAKAGTVKSMVSKYGLNKDEAVGEIDKLQKEILALQTEKEYLKSSYETGLNRFWEIDQHIGEKQEKIYSLQDEFNVGTVIDDGEARKLMASVALKTCQDTLSRLEESHERSVADAKYEHQRILDARDKLASLKSELILNQPDQTPVPDNPASAMIDLNITTQPEQIEELRDKIKEQVDVKFSESLNAMDMAEKIDQLVQKVVSFETAVSSQNALIDRLRAETDVLLSQIRSLEDEKAALLNDTGVLSTRLQEMEGKLSQVHKLDQNVEAQNTNLQTHLIEAHCNLDHLNENIDKISTLPDADVPEENVGTLVGLESEIDSGSKPVVDDPHLPAEVETMHTDTGECPSSYQENEVQDAYGKATDGNSNMKVNAKNIEDQPAALSNVHEDEGMVNQSIASVDGKGNGEEAEKAAQAPHIETSNEFLQTIGNSTPQISENNQSSSEAIGDNIKNVTDDGEPDWRALYTEGMGDREKIILREYTTILRNYKELRQKVSDMEKMNKGGMVDASAQINKLRNLLSKKDEEIQSLRQKLSLLNLNSCEKTDDPSKDDDDDEDEDDDDFKLALADLQPTSVIEEKFRMQIDELLEENLNFWLRFSSSFNQVQKFQTEVEDLQLEISKLEDKISKKQDGGGGTPKHVHLPKSEAKPIYKHLTEIRTEITVWLEQSGLLKEELQRRFSSLCNIQDEISSALLEACEEIEEAEFTSYRAAKFQGEILNMKQENNKVADELQAACEHANRIVHEIDRTLKRLDEGLNLNSAQGSTTTTTTLPELPRTGSKSRIPLRSFIFGVKQKRQRHSFFHSVQPAISLHRKLSESKSAASEK